MRLIITCPRHFEDDTAQEIGKIFERFGYDIPEVTVTEMPGILTADTLQDPVEVAERIVELVCDEPWAVRYIQRIIPVQRSLRTDMADIIRSISEMRHVIGEGQTFRVTIEKRHTDISGKEMITRIADIIPNKVSLDNADWIVMVQVLGARAGVSVIRPEHIVSIEKIKRAMSE